MLTPTQILETYLRNDLRNLNDIDDSYGVRYDSLKILKVIALDMVLHRNQALNLRDQRLIDMAESNLQDLCGVARLWGYS